MIKYDHRAYLIKFSSVVKPPISIKSNRLVKKRRPFQFETLGLNSAVVFQMTGQRNILLVVVSKYKTSKIKFKVE